MRLYAPKNENFSFKDNKLKEWFVLVQIQMR